MCGKFIEQKVQKSFIHRHSGEFLKLNIFGVKIPLKKRRKILTLINSNPKFT